MNGIHILRDKILPLPYKRIIAILEGLHIHTNKTMKRFSYLALLLLIVLPTFAQDEPPVVVEQPLPRDPAFLMRLKEEILNEIRETQRTLRYINPDDTQRFEYFTNRQAGLAKQFNKVVEQLQTLNTPNQNFVDYLPGREVQPPLPGREVPLSPQAGIQRQQPTYATVPPTPYPYQPYPYHLVPVQEGLSMNGGGGMQGSSGIPMHNSTPFSLPENSATNPFLLEQARAWEDAYWGPKLPRELGDVKQSVESLQKEISSLKETIKSLETQIQSLNRIVLLSGQANERMIMMERTKEIESVE